MPYKIEQVSEEYTYDPFNGLHWLNVLGHVWFLKPMTFLSFGPLEIFWNVFLFFFFFFLVDDKVANNTIF